MVYFPWPALEHHFLGTTQFTENNKTTALWGHPPTFDLSHRGLKGWVRASHTTLLMHLQEKEESVFLLLLALLCPGCFFLIKVNKSSFFFSFFFWCYLIITAKSEINANHFCIYCVTIPIFHKDFFVEILALTVQKSFTKNLLSCNFVKLC